MQGNQGIVVGDYLIVGAKNLQHIDVVDGSQGGQIVADDTADGGNAIDDIAVVDGHAVAHEAAQREAGKEDIVLVDIVFFFKGCQSSQQEAFVINIFVYVNVETKGHTVHVETDRDGATRIPAGAKIIGATEQGILIVEIQCLGANDNPILFFCDILNSCGRKKVVNIVAHAVQHEQNRSSLGIRISGGYIFEVLALYTIPSDSFQSLRVKGESHKGQ